MFFLVFFDSFNVKFFKKYKKYYFNILSSEKYF
jgi:hypothetical protein